MVSTWRPGFSQSGPGSDPWAPEAVAADLKTTPKVERLSLDTWVGKQSGRGGLDLGLGLTLPWGRLRPSLQIAQDRAGFGLGWRVIPVLDVTIGVQGIWDLKTGQIQPGFYVSVFRF
ncbi:MAG: hypothetical protein WC986_13705 [Elusimicrobiota bacterium]